MSSLDHPSSTGAQPPPVQGSAGSPERAVESAETAGMKWSLRLGRWAGIEVYLHWTFALLIGWILVANLGAGQSAAQAMATAGFVIVLFVCVLLHEFGHALTARRYGVRTRDITLLPIGGLARLERMPEKPAQEFWVAVAGPAVNVGIAAVLFVTLAVLGQLRGWEEIAWFREGFLAQLMWINLVLAAFNLLPAFPMDGGRVLRALLAARLGRPRATAIAANVGQGMAILFGIVGFFVNPFLIFIAVFVYLGAQAEAAQVETQSALAGLHVGDAMMTRFRTLDARDSVARAADELLAGSQHDFPVMEDGRLVGLLRRNDLVKALAAGLRERPVAEAMSRECEQVREDDVLTQTIDAMQARRCATAPVMRDGQLVGLLTLENVGELLMLNAALSRQRAPRTALLG